jgi:hypothetical protein
MSSRKTVNALTIVCLVVFVIVALATPLLPDIMLGSFDVAFTTQYVPNERGDHLEIAETDPSVGILLIVRNGSFRPYTMDATVNGINVERVFYHRGSDRFALLKEVESQRDDVRSNSLMVYGGDATFLLAVGKRSGVDAQPHVTLSRAGIGHANVYSNSEVLLYSFILLFTCAAAVWHTRDPVLSMYTVSVAYVKRALTAPFSHVQRFWGRSPRGSADHDVQKGKQMKLTREVADDSSSYGAKRHVFLSYCHDNMEEAAKLREELVAAGENVWWDKEILPGQAWKPEVDRAMRASYAVVMCFSKETQTRSQNGIYPEAIDAIRALRQYAPGAIFLIPVRFSPCAVPPFEIDAVRKLCELQHVDLFPPTPRAEEVARLVEAIKRAPEHP